MRALGDDVWLREGGRLDVSAAPAQDGAVERSASGRARSGIRDQAVALAPTSVAQRVSARPSSGAASSFRTARPCIPACSFGLLRRRASQPVSTCTSTRRPCVSATARSTTPNGALRAPEIVLATTRRSRAGARSRGSLTNFGSYVVLTEPVPELLEQISWTGGEAIVDGRMFMHYFRTHE